jgi:hypothetical protein
MNIRNLVKNFSFCAVTIIALAGFAAPTCAAPVGITSSSALGTPIDTFDWSQLPNSTPLSSPQNVTSGGGASGSASSAGNAFEVLTESSSTGWTGNFAPGTAVLWDAQVGPDITFSLANPVTGIGAQIDPDNSGDFTAQITAFAKNGTILGSFSENGIGNSNNDGSAIFIGLLDSSADIAKIKFILTAASGGFPNDFAIGTIDTSGPASAAPLPSSVFLFASALLGLGFFARRRIPVKRP